MPSIPPRAARLILALLLAASLTPSSSPALRPALAGADALPDLATAPLTDFRIETVGGRRLLRFSSTMVNIGTGHFELKGHRDNTSQPMTVEQWIYTDHTRAVPNTIVATGAVAQYSGDGHNHWHVQEVLRFDLWDSAITTRGAKIGFCFFDTDRYNVGLPGASSTPYYLGSGCGTNPNALGNIMGVSIGWGDKYGWFLANQWVDISGLPSGTYTLRARADPNGFFVESNDLNQCAFVVLSFSTGSNAVSIHETGHECINDWSHLGFAGDIAWMYSAGLTNGCAPELFCPLAAVPREQMASFLVRAVNPPQPSGDFFTDDETTPHEHDINRLATAGITTGCSPGRFCPKGLVSREQMASFLARAFNLPPATSDFFVDDESSPHQADINRIAQAGITLGCSSGHYCPTDLVNRGEMAAFLHRAMTD